MSATSTNPLRYRTDYWDDPMAKTAFRAFARDLFQLDFTAWDEAGCWDHDYRPFSFLDSGGRVIASVCLYSMRLVVEGQPVLAGQLSAVATRPEWRRRGLALDLAQRALAWASARGHVFFYLFANDDALPFYARLGFAPVREEITRVALRTAPPPPRAGTRLLDCDNVADLTLLRRLAAGRGPVSQRLGVLNERLLLFHALVPHRQSLICVTPLDTVVLASRAGGVLTIHDLVSPHPPPLAAVLPWVAQPGDRAVELRFEPDRLGDLAALGTVTRRPFLGNNLHTRGPFPFAGPILFPATAQA